MDESPNRSKVEPDDAQTPRRGFLATAVRWMVRVGFAALALVGGLWTAATARFLAPNAPIEPRNRFPAGPPGDLANDSVDGRYKERYGIWLVNGVYRGRRQIYALRAACTHLGCITLWQEAERKFKCPCHGSGFRPDGVNFEGPAPRSLERCAICVADDGRLEIDTSRTFQQELGQWHDPASYVEV